jgi:hypothetical protein
MVTREGYTCKIDFDRRIIDIRITSVKPYKEINEKRELPEDAPPGGNSSIRSIPKVSSIVESSDARTPDAQILESRDARSSDAQPSDARTPDTRQ